MKVSIGLPATIPGTSADLVMEWARKADAGPFASLGIIDRIAYPNYEPMITLAAVAGVTRRVRLMTSALLAPTRNAGVLAKEAATLDVISGGRLTLGLAIGGREDDYRTAPAVYSNRAGRFEEQLAFMKRIWNGETVDGIGPVGPTPVQSGGPELLLGGYAPAAVARIARFADGFISGGLPPDAAAGLYSGAVSAWERAGRRGRPRFVGAMYFALGADAVERGAPYLRHYYAFMGPAVENVTQGMLASEEAVRHALTQFEGAGADEVMLWPCIADLEQVDLLADLVTHYGRAAA